jgi:iron complex transport system ATP-binding protein
MTVAPVVALRDAAIVIDGRRILDGITWSVAAGERWVVLGPNGSGKTTLVRLVSAVRVPSSGEALILGERLGATDMRVLRERIGHASARLANSLRPTLSALDVVVTARHAALEPWWHTYTDDDYDRARQLLSQADLAGFEARTFGTLSEGERQRVLVCRAFMGPVELVTLDEPAAGLDLRNRELLVNQLGALAAEASSPPIVVITHHVEEVPDGFTHVLLLRDGAIVAAGPLTETLTASALSATFDVPLALERRAGRYWATLAPLRSRARGRRRGAPRRPWRRRRWPGPGPSRRGR